MRAYEIDPEDFRLVRLTQVEPLLPVRPYTLYDYTIPDLTDRALNALERSSGARSLVYTGYKGSSGALWSVEERYLEPFGAAKRISGLYSHCLDPLRFTANTGHSPNRVEIFDGFARALIGSRVLPWVELVAANIGTLRELDNFQPGIGSNVTRWMQYLAYEALGTHVARRTYTSEEELRRLRSGLHVIRDSTTILDRYKALARRGL